MKLPLYQIDAFSSRLFGGNPAAVVLLDAWLPDETLQAIAAENNVAETAFVQPRETEAPLRWFSPAVEISLCGHATLATAHVLFKYHFPAARRLSFSTLSGILGVSRDGERLSLDFPSTPGRAVAVPPILGEALGATPREALVSRDLMAVFDTEAEVRTLAPDFGRIAAIDTFGVIATSPGDDVDYVFRFFGPRAGIPEDPATGSAHCTLVPYWAGRLGKTRLEATQLSPRGAEFACALNGDRVAIAGRTVEYLRGEIEVG